MNCPVCDGLFKFPSEGIGMKVPCPHCQCFITLERDKPSFGIKEWMVLLSALITIEIISRCILISLDDKDYKYGLLAGAVFSSLIYYCMASLAFIFLSWILIKIKPSFIMPKIVSRWRHLTIAVGCILVSAFSVYQFLNWWNGFLDRDVPKEESPLVHMARLRVEAEHALMKACTNEIVGFNRMIDFYINDRSDEPNDWTAEVTAEYVNHNGGIDRTNYMPFKFKRMNKDNGQDWIYCHVDTEKIYQKQQEDFERRMKSITDSK